MSEVYFVDMPGILTRLEASRLRREHGELIGELAVKCDLPGAKVVNGYLSIADFNFSSLRTRQDRAKFLQQRASTNGVVDWLAALEDLCHHVISGERTGDPAILLEDVPRNVDNDQLAVDGLHFPKRHPSILFGDGGSLKSYTALHCLGMLARRGLNVALFDWELCPEDHRERLELLFGKNMPHIYYCRCEKPLTVEVDRLTRIVREHKIDYAVYDSIAFAADGPPESAEIASRYFRSVRQIDCGSLHIAHITKSQNDLNKNQDQRPFGSTFWHNGARATWFVKAAEQDDTSNKQQLGFYNRKWNLGRLKRPVGIEINFGPSNTTFYPWDLTERVELAEHMSIRQRIVTELEKRGSSVPIEELAEAWELNAESIERTARRHRDKFVLLSGHRIGLKY